MSVSLIGGHFDEDTPSVEEIIKEAEKVKYHLPASKHKAVIDAAAAALRGHKAELDKFDKQTIDKKLFPEISVDYNLGEIDSVFETLRVHVVERQDEMLMQVIQTIGGRKYSDITVDKNKTLEALRKATAIHPKKYSVCGNEYCNAELVKGQNYCSVCGQKADWSLY